MKCVETASFSFVINREPCEFVRKNRGLRQGDPISPYLFLFCAEALSHPLKHAIESGRILGHKVCALAPSASRLLFANDSLIFCKANRDQALVIKEILAYYENASGQQVNYSKTCVVFNRCTQQSSKDEVLITLDIREVLTYEKNLRLPTHVGHSKKKTFAPIKDRITKKIRGWMGKKLSWAGREVLVKVVTQAIPIYAKFCHEIHSMIKRYSWGAKEGSWKINWMPVD